MFWHKQNLTTPKHLSIYINSFRVGRHVGDLLTIEEYIENTKPSKNLDYGLKI